MYDLCNKLYIDACLQTQKEKNEYRALTDMVDCSNLGKTPLLLQIEGMRAITY